MGKIAKKEYRLKSSWDKIKNHFWVMFTASLLYFSVCINLKTARQKMFSRSRLLNPEFFRSFSPVT